MAQAELTTREKLLEAAGIVFAAKGYDRATSKEICQMAGVNLAAANYHFGGKEKLYMETLLEAHRRMISIEMIKASLSSEAPAPDKLRRLIELFFSGMGGDAEGNWHFRLIVREISNPSRFLDELIEREIRPKSMLFRELAAELTGLDANHPAVHLATLNVLSMCLMPFQNHAVFSRLFKGIDPSNRDRERFIGHIHQFALGGLARIAAIHSAAGEVSIGKKQPG